MRILCDPVTVCREGSFRYPLLTRKARRRSLLMICKSGNLPGVRDGSPCKTLHLPDAEWHLQPGQPYGSEGCIKAGQRQGGFSGCRHTKHTSFVSYPASTKQNSAPQAVKAGGAFLCHRRFRLGYWDVSFDLFPGHGWITGTFYLTCLEILPAYADA